MAGRVVYAGHQLLDRQLVDRAGRFCGKVDDLELEEGLDGTLYVSAILTGAGALLKRTGHARSGNWVRRIAVVVFPSHLDDPGRLPFSRVADLGAHLTLSIDRDELSSYAGERWVADHVVAHIPGNDK
jgi:hypothetical protein